MIFNPCVPRNQQNPYRLCPCHFIQVLSHLWYRSVFVCPDYIPGNNAKKKMNAEQLHLLLYPTTQIEDDSLEKSDEIVRIFFISSVYTTKRNK